MSNFIEPNKKSECWRDYFSIRRVRNIFYVRRKGLGIKPVSPDFTTQGQARSWVKKNWENLVIEEILLGEEK